jgi:hypothetical protein
MKRIHIKWISGNTTRLDIEDKEIYLTKMELSRLLKETKEFIEYYSEDFSEKRIHIEDEPWDDSWESSFVKNK